MTPKYDYPYYILEYLRIRCGLEKTDNSKDDMLLQMTPTQVFSEVLQWHGLLGGWDIKIKGWILDIYGVDLWRSEEGQQQDRDLH